MGRLDGKVAIVTGGSAGIGKAISLLYATEEADVVIISRRSLERSMQIKRKKISYVVGDITKDEDTKKLVEYVKNKFGKLDILVNNAGFSPIKPLKELKIEDYDKTFDLNVRTLINVTIQCLPLIIK